MIWRILGNILCNCDPKVKVKSKKAGICDGVPSIAVLSIYFQNKFKAGTYPGSPTSWLFVAVIVLALKLANVDPSFGMIGFIQNHTPG